MQTLRALSLRSSLTVVLALAALGTGACSDSNGGKKAPPPPLKTDTNLTKGETPPGVVLSVVELSGGSGPAGGFEVGDHLAVRYRVTKTNGQAWGLGELENGRILVSGPTFNYQRVLAERDDLLAASSANPDGTYTYRFDAGLPARYLPPYNDSPEFGPGDGELADQPLLAGTYTVGLVASWRFTVEAKGPYRDAGGTTADFLLGGAGGLAPREMVLQANCTRCHGTLRVHDGMAPDVKLCGLCHTSGAEDRSVPDGQSIDLRVLIHKLHDGKHLPSVLGVATNMDGSRDYTARERPYVLVDAYGKSHDFSGVGFPVWPNLTAGLPHDAGYSSLDADAQAKEDEILTGAADCATCHGDPDGSGPMTAPSQGQLAMTQPTRRACGACHDDWTWDQLYASNGKTMPPQLNDSECKLCHFPSGDSLAVLDAHRHPLFNSSLNLGLHVQIDSLADEGGVADGALQVGEKLAVTFRVTNDIGSPVDVTTLGAMRFALSGPTSNAQMLLQGQVPIQYLGGPQPYVMHVPERIHTEVLGVSTGSATDSFVTQFTPHWNVAGALTEVLVETGSPFSTNLAENAAAGQNYVDVDDASGFQPDDYVALRTCPAGPPEVLRILWVDGERLWFGSSATSDRQPGLRAARSVGDCVQELTLAPRTQGVDYSLDEATGTITEIANAFGAGNFVLANYTSDFVAQATYAQALNDGPDLDETSGKWDGKSLVSGTYTFTLWGLRTFSTHVTVGSETETTVYNSTSPAAAMDFAVGNADPGALEPYALIDGPQTCYACHKDLWYHGNTRRGWEACLACHGTAGAEDRPRYVAPDAPDTPEVQVSFREMLHKIHMGKDLSKAQTYTVVGYAPAAQYPDNYSLHTFEDVGFPTRPGGTARCTTCHGDGNQAWQVPSDRNHPTEQIQPVLAWRVVCGSCHDSDLVATHIAYGTTPGGVEGCAACHGPANALSVLRVHASY